MESFIENYCGEWRSESGYRIEIEYQNEQSVFVAFYSSAESHPVLRPWCNNKPAMSMIGTLDSETQASLDIDLSEKTNSFCLNLSFDFTDSDYSSCTPSIIRLEDESFLEQYYNLLGPLDSYIKC